MWLTRRFVTVLWGALGQTFSKRPDLQEIIDNDVKDAVLGMKHQEAVQNTDFETPPVEDNADATSNTGPLLITGGKVHPGEKLTGISFHSADGADIRFNLNDQLMHAFCHLIVTTTTKAEWKLDLSVGDGQVVIPQGQALVH